MSMSLVTVRDNLFGMEVSQLEAKDGITCPYKSTGQESWKLFAVF